MTLKSAIERTKMQHVSTWRSIDSKLVLATKAIEILAK